MTRNKSRTQSPVSEAEKLRHGQHQGQRNVSTDSVVSRFGTVTEHLVDGPEETDDRDDHDTE